MTPPTFQELLTSQEARFTNEQLEAWAGLGPWHRETGCDDDGEVDLESQLYVCDQDTVCDITVVCTLPECHITDSDKREERVRLIASAPALAAALLAERKAREVEVARLTTSIDIALDWAGAKLADLITACDAALDWADANARAFPIETAPMDRNIEIWDSLSLHWVPVTLHNQNTPDLDFTHWREPLPPPSNPPLPEPLERLGEVLRRVKGVR